MTNSAWKAAHTALLTVLFGNAIALAPYGLRIDLQEVQLGKGVFISLDAVTGANANLSMSWSLPPELSKQTSFSVLVTRKTSENTNVTVYSSGTVLGNAQLWQGLARSALQPATSYDFAVMVGANESGLSAWSSPLRFHTSAGADVWSSSQAVWAPKCGGTVAAGEGNQPNFALFHSDAPVAIPAAATGILSALLYATASPAIYNDPWNVTKLFSGFKLRVNGTLIGVGPGHTACGPYAMSSCTPVQPVDGYDVTSLARISAASSNPTLALDLSSYSLSQPQVAVVPALQLVMVIRYYPEGRAPATVFGTSYGASSPWYSLDADGLYNPSGNKDSGWYEQPREDLVQACLPALPTGTPLAGCPAPYATCTWSRPIPAPGAFANYNTGNTLVLAGKSTQAVQVESGLGFATATKLGSGRWLLDPGFELQGGISLQLSTTAAIGGGLIATVQLGDELMSNGSAMWNTRAGMHYQDVWTFPPTDKATSTQLYAEHHEMSEFRFTELILTDAASGAPLDIDPSQFSATYWRVHYRYDDGSSAQVITSSPELDSVFRLAAFTLKTTQMDIYSDSNTRQRSFDCMADNNVAALSHYSTTTELAMPRMMAAQVMSIGEQGYVSPDWADWTVLPGLNVVNDALYTGDLFFAASYFDLLVANHTYSWLVDSSTGLVTANWLGALIDTSGGSDDGFVGSNVNAVVNAWSYLALRKTAQLGRWLGRSAQASQLDATADSLRSSFQSLLFNGSIAVCDGLCSKTPHTSVHSTFYALYAGLFDNDAVLTSKLASYVRARAIEDPDLGVPCGSYPVQFLLAALYQDGYDHGMAAHNVLTATTKHSWLNMMQVWGATSTMECWLPSELPNLSFSHVWSSSPAIIIPQYFLGVTPTSPGYATLDIKPQMGPVLQATGTLPTVRGPVRIALTQTMPGRGGCMSVALTLPGGVSARVFLPRWNETVVVKVDGTVMPATVQEDFAFVSGVGAGEHTVTTC